MSLGEDKTVGRLGRLATPFHPPGAGREVPGAGAGKHQGRAAMASVRGLWGLTGSWRGVCPKPVAPRAWPDLSFSISFPGLGKA